MIERTPRHRATDDEAEELAARAKRRPRQRRPSLAAFVRESVTFMLGGWPGRLWLMLGALVGVLVVITSSSGFNDAPRAFVVGGFMLLLGWWMSDIPRQQREPGKSEIAVASGLTMILGALLALLLRAAL